MNRRCPTLEDVSAGVKGRAAVFPSLLWQEIGGTEADFAPLWLLEQLRRLGFGPLPAGFWWRRDIPASRAQRLSDFVRALDTAYLEDGRC